MNFFLVLFSTSYYFLLKAKTTVLLNYNFVVHLFLPWFPPIQLLQKQTNKILSYFVRITKSKVNLQSISYKQQNQHLGT